jgi:hypothetical protein
MNIFGGALKHLSLQVPSHSNGVPQLRHTSKPASQLSPSVPYPASPQRDHLSLSLEGTPTPSATPTPPVSPMASDTVRACEALLELGRPLEEGSGKEEVVPRNGACYPASGPKNGDHLLQAVWKGVVGTLLSQQVGSYGNKYPKYRTRRRSNPLSRTLSPRIREYRTIGSPIGGGSQPRRVGQDRVYIVDVGCEVTVNLCCGLALKSCTYSQKSWDLCSESLTSRITIKRCT